MRAATAGGAVRTARDVCGRRDRAGRAAEQRPVQRQAARHGRPGRIAAQISKAEHGDFHNSISDLQRAESGKVVWVMRGMIGERGVAYYAPPSGRSIKPYDPSSPDLSKDAALGQCIQSAHGNPGRLQRCLAKFGP